MLGGTLLAPAGVPLAFQRMVGVRDLVTSALAIIALVGLRTRQPWAISATWAVLVVGMADTVNAVVQSFRYDVFTHTLGVNWVIVTCSRTS